MPNWFIYAIAGVVAIAVGGHNLLPGTGSLILGTHATTVYELPEVHYMGTVAYIEGATFIAAGLGCLYRAWRQCKSVSDE